MIQSIPAMTDSVITSELSNGHNIRYVVPCYPAPNALQSPYAEDACTVMVDSQIKQVDQRRLMTPFRFELGGLCGDRPLHCMGYAVYKPLHSLPDAQGERWGGFSYQQRNAIAFDHKILVLNDSVVKGETENIPPKEVKNIIEEKDGALILVYAMGGAHNLVPIHANDVVYIGSKVFTGQELKDYVATLTVGDILTASQVKTASQSPIFSR
jgi:hypothetical protein